MKVFYQCDRTALCNKSVSCYSDCTHTTDKEHSFDRPERVFRILENGDFWEETPELAGKVKDSGRRMKEDFREDS